MSPSRRSGGGGTAERPNLIVGALLQMLDDTRILLDEAEGFGDWMAAAELRRLLGEIAVAIDRCHASNREP